MPTVLNFNNNFVPAQATTSIQYSANLPTVPVTTASPNASAKTITAAGGLNPADFGTNNPVVAGTPAAPFVNASVTGNAAVDSTANAITGATLLSDLTTPVTSTDTVTVDGTVIDFTASPVPTSPFTITPASAGPPATPATLSLAPGSTVGDLLKAVDQISGNNNVTTASSVNGTGEITLNTGTANDLKVT